ncbi:hypothetical protein [Curtobacterium sp. B18]|uniref:hypothetical protein n=1 Tax=Curtobacterium sp. B18 TaxID=95614 RepID=UPI0011D21C52|nr:hypothetical protein [Curtobacterium sp. B18]
MPRFVSRSGGDRGGELTRPFDDDFERLRHVAAQLSLPVDVDVGEERLIEAAAQVVRRAQVGLVAVAGERERVVEIAEDLRLVLGETVEPFRDSGELRRDRLLFVRVKVGRNDAAEMAVEQLLRAVLQAGLLERQVGCQPDGLLQVRADLRSHSCAESRAEFGCEGDARVEPYDELLDKRDRDGRGVAVVSFRGPSGADEVFVERAVAVDGPTRRV